MSVSLPTVQSGTEAAKQSEREHLQQIGQVAERVGLSIRTVRYYEEMGLLVPTARSQGGFRLYTDENISRLEIIKQMKPLGFSVEEMRELLDIRDHLGRDGLEPAERTTLSLRLVNYVAATEEKYERLRKQVAIAEAFAASLRAELAEAVRANPRATKP
jgi:MerR family copper efflux transcriptional regulator